MGLFLGIPMDTPAFQDFYPDSVAHCYGCGRLNEHGLRIRTHWEGEESVTRFRPRPEHTAVPGYVYGGHIATLLDCHGTGTAAAAMYRQEGRPMDSLPAFRFVTASLQVDYLRPTPIDCELEIRGRVLEIRGRRVTVEATLLAHGVATARGRISAAQMPDAFISG
jgi:acyl-coenzyme A thioesterase PaaI-like protein